MTVAILRAVKEAAPPAAAVWTAMGLMLVFTAVGLTIGWLADSLVVESVRAQAEAQLHSLPSQTQKAEASRVP